MAVAMPLCNTRQLLSAVSPNGVNFFMEKLLFQIYEYFDEQDLVDVTFKVYNPNVCITAHRLILAAASPYFKELFKSDKGVCPLIEITEIDSDTFERLITFCYTGQILITIDNVDQMLKAGIILQLEDAVASCVEFIVDNMPDYTLRRAYALESETDNALLSQEILEYEIRNFMEVSHSTEYLNFGTRKLQKILESDHLNVNCEEDVFKAIIRWYEHDPSARKQQLPSLMGCLHLTQFDPNYIISQIHPLPGCQFLALETLTWNSHPLARSNLTLKYTKPRGGQNEIPGCYNREAAEEFLALNMEGSVGSIYQYNKSRDLWQKWRNIKVDAKYSRAIFMNENLIFIGGLRDGEAINEGSSWNFKTKTMKRFPSMKQPRYFHNIVLLNYKMYAIGGRGRDDRILQSVETYSICDGWQTINDMITPRYGAAAVVLNGKIYVMCGSNEGQLKSVECYDPTTDCWTQCADMNEEHNFPGVTVHRGQIFVAGGYNERGESVTVERYDPQRDEWTKICSLSIPRDDLGCISIYNQLWAVGGRWTAFFSVYDEQNDKWIEKGRIPSAGNYYCFTVPKTLLHSDRKV